MNAHGELVMRRYRLDPGDATRYEFYIADISSCKMLSGNLDNLIGGVNITDYVILGICMSGSSGSYEVRKASLRDPHGHFIGYLLGKMRGVDAYTLCAVVLAAKVLVDRPDDLEAAAESMLGAPALMRDWG